MASFSEDLTDGASIADAPLAPWGTTLVDVPTFGATPSFAYIAGAALVDTVELGVVPSSEAILHALLADKIGLAQALAIAHQGLLIDTLQLDDLQMVVRAVRVIEELTLGGVLSSNARFLQAIVEELGLSDALLWFFGGFLEDTISVSSAATRLYQGGARLAEELVLTEVLARQFITQITMADGFEIADDQIITGIYNGTLCENVCITGGMVMPDGSFTTWAINTRTNAVTEYQNFAFNSFAQMGRRFLGATPDGLYVLDGEVDDGEAIHTRMRSGIMQLAGTKFTMFKGAYLGLRTNDDGRNFILKLIYGDGPNQTETCYRIVVQNLRTAKVNLGKGIRSRYVSWELETLGPDWDFDGIEFIPISSTRRV